MMEPISLQTPQAAPPGQILSPEEIIEHYRLMLLTRFTDERMWILSRQGKAHFVLTGRGQEAAEIASVRQVRVGYDYVFAYYRSLAVAVALGMSPYDIFLGVLARGSDPNSGSRQLPCHFSSVKLRIPTATSVVSAHIPHAVGVAYAARVKQQDFVSVVYFGEGATSKGDFHEAINMAGVWKLPVIFFCENNGYAISMSSGKQMPVPDVATRAAAYGMPGVPVDGTDVLAVAEVMREAVMRARSGNGPTLIEAAVVRLTPHSSDDDDAYRTKEEIVAAQARDPLPRLRDWLFSQGLLNEAEDTRLTNDLHQQVLAAQQAAEAQPFGDPKTARRYLYEETE